MRDETTWFTEECLPHGSSFGLQIKGLLDRVQTPYQLIEIYETTKFGNLMVIDGCYMLSTFDNFLYHEMMSHPALFTHPDPKNVVIIGGGDCGTLREVAKHQSVESIIQIDIDEQVTRMAEKYFPELCEANNDKRCQLHFDDGIAWMKNTKAQSIDLIIVDSTDPVGPAEGLFSKAFYQDCMRALKPNGLLVQQTESPLYHQQLIKDTHHAMREAGFKNFQLLCFPQPIYPSGWWSATMTSKDLVLNEFRKNDCQNKSFKTEYYNADIHQGAMATPEFMKK